MNRLMHMLKNQIDHKQVETKVQRFDSSEGISMLGDKPFVRDFSNDTVSNLN